MKKYTISKNTIEYLTESLVNKASNENELDFIINIKEYIDKIINRKNCLAYDNKRQLHTEICDKIDTELERSKKQISLKFKRELEILRIDAYIKIGWAEWHWKKTPIRSDHFIHKNTKRMNQTSEMLWYNLDFSWEYTTEYFLDRKNLKRDLQFFADQKSEKKWNKIIDLIKADSKCILEPINTPDWRKIKYQSYLHTASNCLLWTVRREEWNEPNLDETLLKMKTILWLYNDKKIPFWKEYFENLDFVKSDLQKFADIMKVHRKWINGWNILDLGIWNPSEEKTIIASNWIEISWNKYLIKAKNWYKTTEWSWTLYHVLNKMKISLGFVLLDEKYFENKDYVKYDLEQFAKHAKKNDINTLTSVNPDQNTVVKLCNWQEKKWCNYSEIASQYYLKTYRWPAWSMWCHKSGKAIRYMIDFINSNEQKHVDKKKWFCVKEKVDPIIKFDKLDDYYNYIIYNISSFEWITTKGNKVINLSNLKWGRYRLDNANWMNNKTFWYFIYELLDENERPIKKDGTEVRGENDINTSIIKDLFEILFKKYWWDVVNT